MKTLILLSIIFLFSLGAIYSQCILLHDPLTSPCIVPGEVAKTAIGGRYSELGWQAMKNGDYLVIEVDDRAGFEGQLSIEITNIDWVSSNTVSGSPKIHFLSMFSNQIADHHIEGGGTTQDALWSLRGGMGKDKAPRYKNDFKVLWASKGAKRTENSDYHERIVKLPSDWVWNNDKVYIFKIAWSQNSQYLKILINDVEIFNEPWRNQVSALKYIYIAKSPDFHTFIGPVFSNLKLSILEKESNDY
jgi:hypothetical protein